MAIAELFLATTGILSTSIGAGIYLTGALHDIERDEPLPRIKGLRLRARVRLDRMNKARLFTALTLKQLQQREASRKAYEEQLLAEANTRAIVGPESRTQYEARVSLARNSWYGALAGEPLEDLIVRLIGRSPSKVVQAKVWEDKVSDGYWVSWLWEGEGVHQEMFVSRQEIAR